jgi:alkylation response protein AidB-like acyl-CoA dehydrogenase
MDFRLSEVQIGLAETLSRFVAAEYGEAKRAGYLAHNVGYDLACWQRLTELGLAALGVSEESGGLGGTLADLMVAIQALGPGLLLDPWLPTFITGRLLEKLGSTAQKETWLERLITGQCVLGFAHTEPGGWQQLSHCTVRAIPGDGYTINGAKLLALGAGADALLVSARTSDHAQDEKGISLFLVQPDARGLTQRSYRLADASVAMTLDCRDLSLNRASLVGPEGEAFEAIEEVIAEACILLSSEAIGIMDAAMVATVKHLQIRKQFKVPLGSFQAIQHRMADCAAELELARSITIRAAILHSDGVASREERLSAAFGAKAFTASAARKIAEETVQFHGAIGITQELWVGRAMKRLLVIAGLFGDERVLTQRYNALRISGGR